MSKTLQERQAAVRREKARRAGRTRRHRECVNANAYQHVLETAAAVLPMSKDRRAWLRGVRSRQNPEEVLAALKFINGLLEGYQPLREGKQVIEGVVVMMKTASTHPWGDRDREVISVDTDCGHNLYGTKPKWLPDLRVGDRVAFWCVVQPGRYKYWSPRPAVIGTTATGSVPWRGRERQSIS